MTRLSPRAEVALETLRQKHSDYLVAKLNIEIEVKQEITKRLAGVKHERDTALRLAAEAGVPKTQLGKAIGTSNYRTVQEIMAGAGGIVAGDEESGTRIDVRTCATRGHWYVSVSNLGEQRLSGAAVVEVQDGNLIYVEEDAFIIPQLYRAGLADVVLTKIGELE